MPLLLTMLILLLHQQGLKIVNARQSSIKSNKKKRGKTLIDFYTLQQINGSRTVYNKIPAKNMF